MEIATMNNSVDRTNKVERWMRSLLSDGGLQRYDDLHIGEIDEGWKPRENWIRGGIEARGVAVEVRNRNAFPFLVALAFSLQSVSIPRGIDFRSVSAFEHLIDWSPPSLYLFEPGTEPWKSGGETIPNREASGFVCREQIDASEIFGETQKGPIHLIEFFQADFQVYNRTLFFPG